ncbi:MAG: tetratricopeptide repeat protein [Bacteroidales bacterium]|nr:tetratricopeptide repeat protein [Bacteroidales bacterium]MCF8457334.1 tetratricopeptide repeat protein [Bacteroidales bacterium]
MRKVVILLIACVVAIGVNAQKNKVVSAINYLKYNELEKAKDAIDQAVVHEKTMNWEKTWWVKAKVYHAINDQCMYNNDQKFCDLAPKAYDIALEAYLKAINLNFTDPRWHNLDILNKEADAKMFANLMMDANNYVNWEIAQDIFTVRFIGLSNVFVNVGVKLFQSEDVAENEQAVESFEKSLFFSSMTGKIDTPLFYYTALAAAKAKQYDKAVEYFGLCTKYGYGEDDDNKAYMYYGLAKNSLMIGDTAKYMESLKAGIDKYPDNNTTLVTELINYYLAEDMSQEALDYLALAIKKVPDNHTFHFAQGSLYDKMEKYSDAEVSYKKAIELKPDYFDANYNLGAIFYNKAVQLYSDASAIPPNEQKKYDAKIAEAKEQLKLAQPYLEKALEINPEDINTLMSLKEIYARFQMYDKSKEMKEKIESLKEE